MMRGSMVARETNLEEKRLDSYVRIAKYLAVLCRYYNKNVKEQFFVVGDLVLKWKTNQAGVHKLATPLSVFQTGGSSTNQ